MALFDLSDCTLAPWAGEVDLKLTTPLGTIQLDAEVWAEDLPNVNLATAKPIERLGVLEQNGYWLSWRDRMAGWAAEMLITEPNLTAEEVAQYGAVSLWVAYLGVSARQPTRFTYSARWLSDYTWTESSPDTGERLAAQSYYGLDGMSLTLATEDEDGLRCRLGDTAPESWKSEYEGEPLFWSDPSHDPLVEIRTGEEGIVWKPPTMMPGESAIMHFAVAWKQTENQDVSAWLAADDVPLRMWNRFKR